VQIQGNMMQLLAARAASGNPLRVGLIGAGKLGAMFINQVGRLPGVHLLGVADLSVDKAQAAMRRAEMAGGTLCRQEMYEDATRTGKTFLTEDAEKADLRRRPRRHRRSEPECECRHTPRPRGDRETVGT